MIDREGEGGQRSELGRGGWVKSSNGNIQGRRMCVIRIMGSNLFLGALFKKNFLGCNKKFYLKI